MAVAGALFGVANRRCIMIRRWLLVVATLLVCILLMGCGTRPEEHDVAQDFVQEFQREQIAALQSQLLEAQSDLTKAQSDLTKAQSDLTKAQSDLTKAENQINTLERDLAAMEGRYAQVLGESSELESQLISLESQLESQLSDYDVLVEKVAKAKIYAEMIDKYILVSFLELTEEERIDLSWLVQYTGNTELIEKWSVFYFSDTEASKLSFLTIVGDALWQVLQ
jgi:septal ring factor EnvC (AmiA/AmiB activator)